MSDKAVYRTAQAKTGLLKPDTCMIGNVSVASSTLWVNIKLLELYFKKKAFQYKCCWKDGFQKDLKFYYKYIKNREKMVASSRCLEGVWTKK